MLSAEEVENLVSYSSLMDVSEHLSFAVRRRRFFFPELGFKPDFMRLELGRR